MTGHDSAFDFNEITKSSIRACENCAGLSLAAAAIKLAEDGLLNVLAPEPLGLDLNRAFARPMIEVAARHHLSFPLIETLIASPFLALMDPKIAEQVMVGKQIITAARVSSLSADNIEGGLKLNGIVGEAPLVSEAHWLITPVKIIGGGTGLAIIELANLKSKLEPRGEFEIGRPRNIVRLNDHCIPANHLISQPYIINSYNCNEMTFRAADLYSCAQSSLDLAISYISTRSQFGQKLVKFQALRHDLARARLVLESGSRLLDNALSDESQLDVTLAKSELVYSHAASVTPAIAEMALQMHGGMGFTWDVPAHIYLRRIRAQISSIGLAETREKVADRAITKALQIHAI